MATQFTPCPACGAVGEVGSTCQFCGTTIILKEGATSSTERVPHERTVTPQQYAEKISIYHNIKPLGKKLLWVSIGNQYGIVNMNGDIVYPLGNDEICIVSEDTIKLGYKYEKTLSKASKRWNTILERWEYEEAITSEEFVTRQYFNLETCIYADIDGFVRDKDNPNKLYRVDVKRGWKPINTYTNLEGKVHSYDYAEQIVIKCDNSFIQLRNIYLLHQGNQCSLWILYNSILDEEYFDNIELSDEQYDDIMSHNTKSPICVLEGIYEDYKLKMSKTKLQIALRTVENIDVVLTLAKKNYDEDGDAEWIEYDFNHIYKQWCKAIKKQVPQDNAPEIDINEKNSKDNITEDTEENKGLWGYSKKEWIIATIGFILWTLYTIFSRAN